MHGVAKAPCSFLAGSGRYSCEVANSLKRRRRGIVWHAVRSAYSDILPDLFQTPATRYKNTSSGCSPASPLHEHFRSVTSMSPLHYQKVLRLQEARRLMLSTMMDAGTTSQQVGYLSASQFSREYSRFFGSAPARDIARLRQDAGLSA